MLDCGPLSTYLWGWTGSTYQRAWTLDHGGCMYYGPPTCGAGLWNTYCTCGAGLWYTYLWGWTVVHVPVGLDCGTPTCGAGLWYTYMWGWTVVHLPVGLDWGTATCCA
jgi:hypothetical protein